MPVTAGCGGGGAGGLTAEVMLRVVGGTGGGGGGAVVVGEDGVDDGLVDFLLGSGHLGDDVVESGERLCVRECLGRSGNGGVEWGCLDRCLSDMMGVARAESQTRSFPLSALFPLSCGVTVDPAIIMIQIVYRYSPIGQ